MPLSSIFNAMNAADLNVACVLADMGNGEVQNPVTDLPKVTGNDDPISQPGRIVHWDAEWHWDATFDEFEHQALGGHLVSLGLSEAHQIWEEYTYPVLQWARDQDAISGFVHLQYLGTGIPQNLDCCTPIELPVEVALGMVDFISEDVGGSDSAMLTYYRLLNCGFRPGFAAASDSPCGAAIGTSLTYVQVSGTLTYRKWIEGLASGRTVASRNGRKEFLDFKVNGNVGPGGEIAYNSGRDVTVSVQWSAIQDITGRIELVHNGVVIASEVASVGLNEPATLTATVNIPTSGWLAARRMSSRGHELLTGAVFVIVNGAAIRANAADAQFYVSWIDSLLTKTAPGGVWSSFFNESRQEARARYQAARDAFQQIANEAGSTSPLTITTSSLPAGFLSNAYQASLVATGGIAPRTWSIVNGALPPGLTLNATTGAITGVPTVAGTFPFTTQVRDSRSPAQTISKEFNINVSALPPATSIWPVTTIPGTIDNGPDRPVELGVKFRSDVAGSITGIRFYKSAANVGTHAGSLWTTGGVRLATATFSNESSSGWQFVRFTNPVPIQANTTYIASYHCPVGHYSVGVNYFATQGVDQPPLRIPASGAAGGNGVFAYGSSGSFPNQTWRASNYWVDVLFEGGETSRLVSIAVTPSAPSISVGATQAFAATGTYEDGSTRIITDQVTWTSSAIGVASINASGIATGVASGTATVTAALGAISSGATLRVLASPLGITTTALPTAYLTQLYQATLVASGGTAPVTWAIVNGVLPPGLALNPGSGIISGTPSSAGTFQFTIEARDAGSPAQTARKNFVLEVMPTASTVTIWPVSTVPGVVDGGSSKPVELGVKFRTDVTGLVTGVRFYKSSANTGTHVGSLWTSTGTRLASATFVNESASGWQQVLFSQPVSVNANTVYIASYHCPNGHYSADPGYFASSGVDRPPLHLLANGVSGGNGVYRYGPAGSFPTSTWMSANYWVDVQFQGASSSDATPPTVLATTPQSGASGVSVNGPVTLTMSEGLAETTITSSTIALRDSSNVPVPAAITYDRQTRTVSLAPTTPLKVATSYSLRVLGGASGIADESGNRMVSDVILSFSTVSYGAAAGGPGGPILVITHPSNPFSRYTAEILLAEGLNAFSIKDVSEVTATTLATADVVILGSFPLTAAQVAMFTNWVNGGGNLIAMRPDKKLAGLLGLIDADSVLSDGYLLVNTSSEPGSGIVAETIQYHGAADRYTLDGATSVAGLYTNATTPTVNPAVSVRNVGSNGGQAAAFTFDLARSIAQTRQGNPAWAQQERDGVAPLRSSDLFYGGASFDPQADWIDLSKVAIPQADEQQRLLANMITTMNADRNLLPRFWYFPHGHQAAIVLTGDDRAENGTKGRFELHRELSSGDGSVEDWEAIRSTSYIFVNSGGMTDAEASAFTAVGFELGLHLDTQCVDYTEASLDSYFSQQLAAFNAAYPGVPSPRTIRNHCIAWSGYTIAAEVQARHGIRLDTNYYFWPTAWVSNRPGFMTGSGIPMRFASADGQVIDSYQAATQMTDDSGQTYPFTINQLLDKAQGPEGYYGAFVADMRTDLASTPEASALLASAMDRGVPVISALQLLNWTEGRNSSSFAELQWANRKLTFAITAGGRTSGLKAMVPVPDGTSIASVLYNGQSVPYSLRSVKGIQYVFFDALTGAYEVQFGQDSTPPAVSEVLPVNGAANVALNTEVRVTFSESLEETTLTSANVLLRDPNQTLVPVTIAYIDDLAQVTLTPTNVLKPSTVYTLILKGGAGGVSDASGNPLRADYQSSFTTVAVNSALHSLWSDSVTPGTVTIDDPKAVELGLKFRSMVNGRIVGVRFYKSPSNTGPHIGTLWTGTGAALSTVTFTNETASGWQYQAFPTPVPIVANTTYMVSYHTQVGFYSTDVAYFSNAITNGPLRALSNSEAGGNGMYRYGAHGLPNKTYKSSNYWVDVVFEANP